MMLLRLMLTLLSVVAWQVRSSHAWAMPIVVQYIAIEREVDRLVATPTAQRQWDAVFAALGGLVSGQLRAQSQIAGGTTYQAYVFAHLEHFEWMTSQYPWRARKGGPLSLTAVITTAKQWTCAQLVDTLLSTYSNSQNRRWLAQGSNGDDLVDNYDEDEEEALVSELKGEIARMHEATQVQIALSYGEDDKVVGPKYMELFETCLSGYLKDLAA